jgi:CheY-like chemotaxis protein
MLTILIAEDNEGFRYTLYWILAKHGYRVLVAAHGTES